MLSPSAQVVSHQKDPIWVVNIPQTQNPAHFDAHVSGALQPKYHIKVTSLTQGGQAQLVGRSNSFLIATTTAVRKREDESYVPLPPMADPNDGVDISIPAPPAADAPVIPTPETSGLGTTFPNTPAPPIVDPADLPTPLNPPVEGVVFPASPEPTPQPTPSKSAIFLKYAGAGAAILSTIGVGVGGLAGGAVGGTIGLVLGLVVAGVNSLFVGK